LADFARTGGDASRSVPLVGFTKPFCPARSLIEPRASALRDVARLFLKLGLVGFGGPAAHIALMRDEVVRRRGWMGDEEFMDAVGAVNLLPGPNSTELALHIGRRQAGTAGLLVAGACFILPPMALVLVCAWAYVRYGHLPAVLGAWAGAQPVVVAVVAMALAGFARTALRTTPAVVAGLLALVLAALGMHELVVLLAAGLLVLAVRMHSRTGGAAAGVMALVPWLPAAAPAAATAVPGLGWLFLFFFKTGAVLYGSGYVLLSFLRGGLVERGGWLTEAQLLDAVAAGQLTPGPVFTTATFIGYLLHGVPGGLVATVGIFLPAFLLVGVSGALIPWLRRSPPARAFLDGVNAGSVALMAVVTWELGRHALTSPWQGALAAGSVLLLRAGVNSSWLVAGGALAGALLR
jgi:chromate transporter